MTDSHQLARHALVFALNVGRLAIWLVLLVSVFGPLEWLFALHPAKFWRKLSPDDLAQFDLRTGQYARLAAEYRTMK